MGEYKIAHFLSFAEAATAIVMVVCTTEVATATIGRVRPTLLPTHAAYTSSLRACTLSSTTIRATVSPSAV